VPHLPIEQCNPWDLPVDTPSPDDPTRRLAHLICDEIERLLAANVTNGNGAPYRPKDVMILCQRRGAQFHEIIRTLSLRGIPTAGSDRVSLKNDVAVKDFMALLRLASNRQDDLSLAEALKSPLWQFTEDDLYALAYDRGGRSLWSQLRAAAEKTGDLSSKCATARDEMDRAFVAGAQKGPFAFLSLLLEQGHPNGRYRFRQRLGQGSDEAINEILNEALAFELKHPRHLDLFLAHLEEMNPDIKKEGDSEIDMVRVMTVHGAKGLEAPVVFLADCQYFQQGVGDILFPLCEQGEALNGFLAYAPGGKQKDAGPVKIARDLAFQKQMEEYRRKLYVAATRAEERLYFCGIAPKKTAASEDPRFSSWHTLAVQAFARMGEGEEVIVPWAEDTPLFRIERGEKKGEKPQEVSQKTSSVPDAPTWLQKDVPPETSSVIAFPSTEGAGEELSDQGPVMPPRCAADGELDPRARGQLLHMALQYLPEAPPDRRADLARRLFARHAPQVSHIYHEEWTKEVMAVLGDPLFHQLFMKDARAEVAIQGVVDGQRYSGQIDRLLVQPDKVLFIDFKTHRPPPQDIADLPAGIRTQMSIYSALLAQRYPDRPVEGAVLWTYAPRLMPIYSRP
ncbi:MAG: 3'-5' exonuclease, partial [Pseudomonadota bacterium]